MRYGKYTKGSHLILKVYNVGHQHGQALFQWTSPLGFPTQMVNIDLYVVKVGFFQYAPFYLTTGQLLFQTERECVVWDNETVHETGATP